MNLFAFHTEGEFQELDVGLLVLAKRRVGAWDAEDIVQETYLRVLQGRRRFKGQSPRSKEEMEQLLVNTVRSLCSHALRSR
jgi:DNA-directed RNA polymerase specialized sigma24 family protein